MATKKTAEPRIVVTVDSAARAEPALALAAMLAKTQQRALHGLFIEDADLLAVARLPFAREFPRAGGAPRSFDNSTLERQMARLAEQYRQALERQAEAASVPWSYTCLRTSKRLVLGSAEASTDLLVIGQPSVAGSTRTPRILLLDGTRPAVLRTLDTVLASASYANADLLVHGEFDAQALNRVLAEHPGVTRRLMGGPSLKELLTGSAYRPSLVLLARDADAAELEPCLRLADCPVIAAAES